jgi:hypothetical protein
MKLPEPDADDTIRIGPPPRAGLSRALIIVAAAVAVLLVAGGSGWLLLRRPAVVAPPPPTAALTSPAAPAPAAPFIVPAPSPQAPASAFQIETANEDQILHHIPTALTVFRFAGNPRILVLDFASLHEQGMMLNRVAALIEKGGLPRDRALNDTELDGAIRAAGDTADTYYYGHDYSAASLARFFSLAERDHVALNPEEERLRALLQQVGWLQPGASGGLISLPAVGADPHMTLAARAAILRHELSHGEFFSDPAYAGYVRNFWLNVLTAKERAGVREFLGREEYDTHDEVLMYNEMQAYLMFTRDPLFFTPDMAGLTPARLAELQEKFLAGMPAGWLRDALASYRTATATR